MPGANNSIQQNNTLANHKAIPLGSQINNDMNTAAAAELETDVEVRPDGYARVTLRGWLNAETTVDCWNQLERDLRGAKISALEVDASGLQLCGGAGLALLRYLNMGKMTPKAGVSVTGLEPGLDK